MKSGKLAICLVYLFLIKTMAFAQLPPTLPDLPKIVPPSPEAATLANTASINTSLYTGAASVQIPLFEIQEGDIKMPLSLSYSSNGIRVNDIPSRVGLGWNLFAGGLVTKTIHDQDDDDPATIREQWPANTDYESLYTYAVNALMQNHDTQNDEFSFNVNGMSGKFFMKDGVPRQVEHSNLKIERVANEFKITTGEGIQYIFGNGGINEQTHQQHINGINLDNGTKTTAWFLTKIISANKEHFIEFVYKPISIYSLFGQSQHVILRTTAVYTPPGNTTCNYCGVGNFPNPSPNYANYDTWFLSEINSSSGITVSFQYEARPGPEASHDNRITSIAIKRRGEILPFKFYEFHYQNKFIVDGDYYDPNQRFYLTDLVLKSNSNEIPDQHHNFTYYDNILPSQLSCAQDYFGYFNGLNQANLVPRPPDFSSYVNGSSCANRSPDFQYAIKGSLQKVIYPTGGSEEFIYEPHTKVVNISNTSFSQDILSTIGQGVYAEHTVTFDVVINSVSANDNIEFTTYLNPLGPSPGSPNYWEAGDGKIISTAKIIDLANQQVIYDMSHYAAGDFTNAHVDYQVGHHYRVYLTVKGLTYKADIVFKYNPVTTITPTNVAGCGIRVKQINSFDPVTNKTYSKYYSYVTAEGSSIGNLSSGVGRLDTWNMDFYPGGGVCHAGTPEIPGIEIFEECSNLYEISSSSMYSNYLFSGSPIAYNSVLESDDPNFIHGAVQHVFTAVYDPIIVGSYLNDPPTSAPGALMPDYNGTEILTRYFKKQGDQFIVQKEQENVYEETNDNFFIAFNYVVRKRWDSPGQSNWTYYDKCRGLDIGGYPMQTGTRYLTKTITREYDEAGQDRLVNVMDYVYGNAENCLPTFITTTNSEGETLSQQIKYPADFQATSPYSEMVSNHIITPVIERVNSRDGNFLTKLRNNYQSWSNSTNTPFFQMVNISTTKGNTTESKIDFKALDNYGNPLHILKTDGISTAYIWDYYHSFPIAEVSNANPADVAYTSFETHEGGNWTLSNGSYSYVNAMTGKLSYTGNLSKAVNSDQKYIVTIWSKNEAIVNGTQGTAIKTVRGWTLYQWDLQGVSNINVVGNTIDEVRLYPSDASITTYTYLPFVGVTSVSDANNNIVYYDYDGLNRMWLVRDIDLNIVKQYEYRYGLEYTVTGSTSPLWVPTGVQKCESRTGPNNYNNTGNVLEEQRDENNMSLSYGQTRWIMTLNPQMICPVINCDGPDKRIVNDVCETASKILISSTTTQGGYICNYRYEWTDGYQSQPFSEFSDTPCTQIVY